MDKVSNWIALASLFAFLAIPPQALAQAAFDEAIRYYKAKDYNTALVLLQSLFAKDYTRTEYHYYAALCYQQTGKLREAATEYEWVAKHSLDPTAKANARQGLAWVNKYSATKMANAGSPQRNTGTTSATPTAPSSQSAAPLQATRAVNSLGSDCLFFPTINLKDGRSVSGGKAWCARLSNGQTVLLTALHLLGPACGLDSQIPAEKVSAMVNSVDLVSADGSVSGHTTTTLSKSGSTRDDDDDCSGDVMFFQAPTSFSSSKAFSIANTPARIGQRCWFYTCLNSENLAQCLPGTVSFSSEAVMHVRLDHRVATRATSGSPILDQSGQVIGMLSGHFESSGELICVPGSAIAGRIYSDLRR